MADTNVKELLYEKAQQLLSQYGRLYTLLVTLRWATTGADDGGIPRQGWWRGGIRWLEAVVVPFYMPWASGFVFLGAAVLLLLLGIRRFTGVIGEEPIIAAFVAEGFFLLVLFLLLLLAPGSPSSTRSDELSTLVHDLNDIATDITRIVESHDQLLQRWQESTESQSIALQRLDQLLQKLQQLPLPGAALVAELQQLQQALSQLNATIRQTVDELQHWRNQQLQSLVQQELARILATYARTVAAPDSGSPSGESSHHA